MNASLRKKIFEVIFEADTRAGKRFDLALMITIFLSVAVVILESVPQLNTFHRQLFRNLEWVFTSIFTLEYLLRIVVSKKKLGYVLSFYGIIDLLAILPAFISFFFVGASSLLIIRAFRLLRIFRILKISRYSNAGRTLGRALLASREKLSVFLFAVLTIILFVGTVMYLIEGEKHGFVSIPKSIYWAIVTITTVGYGDLTPQTALGQFLSSILMITGYAIIAVPTGIISVELSRKIDMVEKPCVCPDCFKEGHEEDAAHCKFCGARLKS